MHNLYGIDDANSEKYLALMGKTNFLALLPSGIREFAMKNGMSLSNKPASIIMPDEFTVEEYIQKQLAMQTGKEKIPYELTALIRVFVSYFYTPKISNNPFADKSEFDQVLLTLSKSTEIASLVGIIKSHGQIWQNDDFNVETFAERMIDAITKLAYYNAIRDHNYTNYADALLELIRFCIPNGEIEKITAIKESFDKRVQEEMEKDTVTSSIKQQLTSIKKYFDINFYSTWNNTEHNIANIKKSDFAVEYEKHIFENSIRSLSEIGKNEPYLTLATLDELAKCLEDISITYEKHYDFVKNISSLTQSYTGTYDTESLHKKLYKILAFIDYKFSANRDSYFASVIIPILTKIIDINYVSGNKINLTTNIYLKLQYSVLEAIVKIFYRQDQDIMNQKLDRLKEVINTYRPES